MRDREDPRSKIALVALEAMNVLRDAQEGFGDEVFDIRGAVASQIAAYGSREVVIDRLPSPCGTGARGCECGLEVPLERHATSVEQ